MTFDPKRRLVMATFKTVMGHNLIAGRTLTIVEEPSAPGEVDEAMAARLFNSKNAVYFEDARPTPVETPEQEAARLAREALRDATDGELTPTDDLVTWQVDDPETGKKAGAKVTKDDLLAIAEREGAAVETDDNKGDLIRKIMERRATPVGDNTTNSGTVTSLEPGLVDGSGLTGAGTVGDADTGADGDAHGEAGEGEAN
jgi:hypothetical protein